MENSGMRNMTLRKIAEAVRGELYMEQVPENMEADTAWAKGVVIDSRLVKAGYIFEKLKEYDIYVRHWEKERISNYLRITIGTDEEMDALFRALREIIK